MSDSPTATARAELIKSLRYAALKADMTEEVRTMISMCIDTFELFGLEIDSLHRQIDRMMGLHEQTVEAMKVSR